MTQYRVNRYGIASFLHLFICRYVVHLVYIYVVVSEEPHKICVKLIKQVCALLARLVLNEVLRANKVNALAQ